MKQVNAELDNQIETLKLEAKKLKILVKTEKIFMLK